MIRRAPVIVGLALVGAAALWVGWGTGEDAAPEELSRPVAPSGAAERRPGGAGVPSIGATPLGGNVVPVASPQASPVPTVPIYRQSQLLVRASSPDDLASLVDEHGVTMLRQPGRSGYALIGGSSRALAAMVEDPRVIGSAPNGRTEGSSEHGRIDHLGSMQDLQWHLHAVELRDRIAPDGSFDHESNRDVVVAVLDTGLAYETRVRDGVAYTRIPSLDSDIIAPYDFVNDDPYANDDHQHGTHIASVIASAGEVRGIAPRTSLMPIKVLGADNQGDEYALIEGIWHAIDHGADIINFSLSFQLGYRPSYALQEALQVAHEEGIYLIGAAGNGDVKDSTWPAASPLVLSVGAVNQGSSDPSYPDWYLTRYTNWGSGVDVVAPGGTIVADVNRDGVVDGILAESIDPADPARTGYWMMGGTSQAAAVVSGLAVKGVLAGMSPERWQSAIRHSPHVFSGSRRNAGFGDGLVRDVLVDAEEAPIVYASVLPVLRRVRGRRVITVRTTVWDAVGQPMRGVAVYPTLRHEGRTSPARCSTNADGQCSVHLPAGTVRGAVDAQDAWMVSIDAVQFRDHGFTPRAALSYTDQLEAMVHQIHVASEERSTLVWHFETGSDEALGNVLESYLVADLGSGLSAAPTATLLTPALFERLGPAAIADGVGTAGRDYTAHDMGGTGLASLPFGVADVRFLAFPGLGGDGGPGAAGALGDGLMVPLDGGAVPRALRSSALYDQLRRGDGWWTNGFGGGSLLSASSYTQLRSTEAVELDGTGFGAVRFAEARASIAQEESEIRRPGALSEYLGTEW